MRTIHFRMLSISAAAFFLFAGSATAQTKSTPILNSVELQQLVKRAEPGDNARLAAHFAALADQYATQAKRHTAMAQAFIGSPTRRTSADSAADHCKRLAELNDRSASTLRELVTHHEKLARGAASTAPPGSTPFESGAGARTPTEEELRALAARASTPADHRTLQEYFLTAAKRYTADANEHATMAAAYRGTKIASAAVHCDRLVMFSRDAAKEANAAAALHKDRAGAAR